MPDRDDDFPNFTPGTTVERQMCAICHARLNPAKDPDGKISFIHGTYADHEPRPVNEVPADTILVCDFCLVPHPTWDFPCGEVGASVGDTVMISYSDWASCNTCKELIDADQYPALVERILHNRINVDPTWMERMEQSPALMLVSRASLTQQMNDFRQARTGPPISIAQAQWVAAKLSKISGEPE